MTQSEIHYDVQASQSVWARKLRCCISQYDHWAEIQVISRMLIKLKIT